MNPSDPAMPATPTATAATAAPPGAPSRPASPGPRAAPAPLPRTLIWDLPLRAFHWLLAMSFAGAWLTADSETWRNVHVVLGYGVVLLLGFRLVWGFVGTRYARFAALRLSPRALREELAGLWARRPVHVAGHNAPGSWAIVGLLGLLAATVLTGTLQFLEIGPDLGELHEAVASAALALVAVHVVGVLVSSLLHRENLVRAMITGTKRSAGAPAAGGPRRVVAAALVVAVVALWTGLIPAPGLSGSTPLASLQPGGAAASAGRGGAGGGVVDSRADSAQSSTRHRGEPHSQHRHDD